MNLVKQAKKYTRSYNKPKEYSKKERDLAMAYIKGEVSSPAVRKVMNTKSGLTIYSFITRATRQAIEKKEYRIQKLNKKK